MIYVSKVIKHFTFDILTEKDLDFKFMIIKKIIPPKNKLLFPANQSTVSKIKARCIGYKKQNNLQSKMDRLYQCLFKRKDNRFRHFNENQEFFH